MPSGWSVRCLKSQASVSDYVQRLGRACLGCLRTVRFLKSLIPMSHTTHYLLRITRRGPSAAPFGWQIIRQKDSIEIARSAKTFPTRTEALADSVRAAAPLALGGAVAKADETPEGQD